MKKKDKDIIVIKKNKKLFYPYCKKCGKPSKPVRDIKNDLYYHIWIISIVASLGFAFPVFLIYHYTIKKKKFCAICSNTIKLYESPDKFPGSVHQIERIVKEIEVNKVEHVHCNFCHEKIDKNATICPSCGISMEKE